MMGGHHDQEWKIMNDAFGCPRATQVLMETLESVNLTEFHPRYTNKLVNLHVNALDGWMCESTIKLKIPDEKSLQYHNESTPELARYGSAWGTESGVGEVC